VGASYIMASRKSLTLQVGMNPVFLSWIQVPVCNRKRDIRLLQLQEAFVCQKISH